MKRCLISLLLLPFVSVAQLRVAKIFSDNMVLQRDKPMHIWGKASPEKTVVVQFGRQTKKTTAKNDSTWSATFAKRGATAYPLSWLENTALPEWTRERGKQNVGNNPAGFKDDLGLNHAYKPGFAYESGVKPLLSFPIKGELWYQGESNSLEKERVEEYRGLLHLLIDDYRKGWKQPALPFYWVQLSSVDTTSYQSQYWPQFRDEQRKLLNEVKNGGMAVCSDIGFKDNVHPTNKKDVGERLARWALQREYGEDIVPSGPLPLRAVHDNGKITVSFSYQNGLQTADGKALRGFSLDGTNELTATIQGDKITIGSADKPAFVYYGWKPFCDANLVNAAGLPASTFKMGVK